MSRPCFDGPLPLRRPGAAEHRRRLRGLLAGSQRDPSAARPRGRAAAGGAFRPLSAVSAAEGREASGREGAHTPITHQLPGGGGASSPSAIAVDVPAGPAVKRAREAFPARGRSSRSRPRLPGALPAFPAAVPAFPAAGLRARAAKRGSRAGAASVGAAAQRPWSRAGESLCQRFECFRFS